jgi:hypothetical protein
MGGMTVSLDAENPQPEVAAPSAPGRWAWWLLRLLVTVQALDAFLQAVFEGRFLAGDFAMLGLHRTNGTLVGGASMGVLVASVVAWRVARVPGRIVLGLALLGPLAGLQIFLGFRRTLGIHVPLGVAIIALSGWLGVWLWTHHPAGDTGRERR